MKKLIIATLSVLMFSTIGIAPSFAGSYCNNGTYSANSGKGTCSKNGGVNKQFNSFSDPGSSSYNRQNGFSGNSFNNGFGTSTKKNSYGSNLNNNGFGSSLKNNGYSNSNGGFGYKNNSNSRSGISNGLGSLSRNCPAFTNC